MRYPRTWLTGLVAAALSAVPAVAQTPYYYGPQHMWDGGGYGWHHGWLFGPLMMVAVLAVIVIVVVLLVRWLGPGSHHAAPSRRDPLDILKERFAHGEIDREEFEERRRVLRD